MIESIKKYMVEQFNSPMHEAAVVLYDDLILRQFEITPAYKIVKDVNPDLSIRSKKFPKEAKHLGGFAHLAGILKQEIKVTTQTTDKEFIDTEGRLLELRMKGNADVYLDKPLGRIFGNGIKFGILRYQEQITWLGRYFPPVRDYWKEVLGEILIYEKHVGKKAGHHPAHRANSRTINRRKKPEPLGIYIPGAGRLRRKSSYNNMGP